MVLPWAGSHHPPLVSIRLTLSDLARLSSRCPLQTSDTELVLRILVDSHISFGSLACSQEPPSSTLRA